MAELGNIAIIANPVAQNGKGALKARQVFEQLGRMWLGGETTLHLTQSAGHAARLACELADRADTLVVVGGDGVIHETVNGLMGVPFEKRPLLGVVPAGSGNDYANTLGMSEDVAKAVVQLMKAREVRADVGCVNGQFFTETLSFGLDAAIALGTVEARKRNGHSGTRLYLEVGIDQLLHHLDLYGYRMLVDGSARAVAYRDGAAVEQGPYAGYSADVRPGSRDDATADTAADAADGSSFNGRCLLAAVQVGPTYGGGFHICPDARIDDGMLDVCFAHPPLSVPYATFVFLRAKDGHHTGYKQVEFLRAPRLTLRFDGAIPAQIDGERIEADEYEISCVPGALRVLSAR